MPSTHTPDLSIGVMSGRRGVAEFIALPERLFSSEADFVPPLHADVKSRIDKKHPYFLHADAENWLASRNGRVVGRISATVNHLHNEIHCEKTGFFGFFECEDNQETADLLFNTAAAWLHQRGMNRIRGPASYSSNDEFGLFLGGDPGPPRFLMPWNPSYYVRLIENFGFTKVMDLHAWHMWTDDRSDLARWTRISARIKEREGITLRQIDMRRFKDEVDLIRDLYADAWSKNWGFVPMTTEEFDLMASQMKSVLIPSWVIFVEKNGVAVGFGLALPDLNQIIKNLKGKLFPFGWLKLLLGKNKCDFARVVTLGVRREFQGRGIDSILYDGLAKAVSGSGVDNSELGWVLENNDTMNHALERAGGRISRRYRVYERTLEG